MRLNFWKKEQAVDVSGYQLVNVSERASSLGEPNSSDTNVSSIYRNLASWVLLVGVGAFLLFFLPLGTGPLEQNKELFLILFSGAALVFWLVDVVSSGYFKWRTNEFIKPVGALLLAVSLVSIFSAAKFKGLYGLSNSLSNSLVVVFGLSVVFFLIVNIFEDKGEKVQKFLALSLFGVFAYGVLQIFGINLIKLPIAKSQSFNTVGSLNTLGILAAASLPFLHKAYFPIRWFKNYLPKVGLGLALLTLVILNWWVLWTVAIVGMFALVGFESLNSKAFKISKSVVPLIVIVLGVFLMVVHFEIPLKNKLPVEIAPSHSLSWRIAKSVLKEKFILGYGPENFSLAFDRFGSPALSNTSFSTAKFYDATSEFLNSLVHGGIVLAAAFLFLLSFVTWKVFKFYKDKASEGVLSEGTVSMMIALASAFFLYPFNISLMFVFYLTLAMVALVIWGDRQSNFSIEKSPILSLISSLGFIGGLILVLLTSYFGLLFYFSDVKYAKALKESDNQKSASVLAEAIKWNGNDDRYYRTLSQTALNMLAEEIKKPNSDPSKGKNMQNYITSSVNFAKKAADIGPKESLNWANLGNIYKSLLFVVDNVDKLAEDAYLKAAEFRTGDATYYNQIGNLYLTKGDRLLQLRNAQNAAKVNPEAAAAYKKSEDALKKAVEISNNFGLAIYNLGTVYDRQGKTSEALKQLEKLAPFNSNQAGLMFELGLLYYRAGKKDDAFNQLQRAVLLAPDYANARWYLALIYEEKNDINLATEQLEKILSVDVNKDNQIVIEKLNNLKKGKLGIPPGGVLGQKPL